MKAPSSARVLKVTYRHAVKSQQKRPQNNQKAADLTLKAVMQEGKSVGITLTWYKSLILKLLCLEPDSTQQVVGYGLSSQHAVQRGHKSWPAELNSSWHFSPCSDVRLLRDILYHSSPEPVMGQCRAPPEAAAHCTSPRLGPG